MARRLTKDELIRTMYDVMDAESFSSEEINQKLMFFCINCPDPVAAMALVVESGPDTPEEIVEAALAYPPRDPRTVPESELHRDHPLRHMTLEP